MLGTVSCAAGANVPLFGANLLVTMANTGALLALAGSKFVFQASARFVPVCGLNNVQGRLEFSSPACGITHNTACTATLPASSILSLSHASADISIAPAAVLDVAGEMAAVVPGTVIQGGGALSFRGTSSSFFFSLASSTQMRIPAGARVTIPSNGYLAGTGEKTRALFMRF